MTMSQRDSGGQEYMFWMRARSGLLLRPVPGLSPWRPVEPADDVLYTVCGVCGGAGWRYHY